MKVYCAIVRRYLSKLFVLMCLTSVSAFAQTPAFTYQGRLTDNLIPPTGTYQMQFSLFDALMEGTQVGSTITNNTVSVANGIFSVSLDFGAASFATGADRFLEIAVRHTAVESFVTLTPRQQITSSPYSIRTLSATAADSLSSACVLCVTDEKINSVAGSKVTGTVANATNATTATSATTATTATSATTATTAGNVTGTVALANGGTGAGNAATARTNLGLGTLATVTPTGTANNTTFLRGDNAWASAGPGTIFSNSINMSASTPSFTPLGGGVNSTFHNVVEMLMPVPCTFSNLYIAITPTSAAPAADMVTITLWVNNAATALTASLTSSTTQNVTTTTNNTANTVAVVAGNTVAFQVVQGNSAPTVRLSTSIRCQ